MFAGFPDFRDLDATRANIIGPSSAMPPLVPGYSVQKIVPGPSVTGLPLGRISDAWWAVTYDGTDVRSYRYDSNTWVQQRTLFQETRGLTSLDMSFDQLGRELVCYEVLGIIRLFWFDPVVQDDVVAAIAAGTSATIGFDYPTETSNSESDVTLIYARGRDLYIRLQRDRFTVEYESNVVGDALRVVTSGRNVEQRYQLDYTVRAPRTDQPAGPCDLSIEIAQRHSRSNTHFVQPLSASNYIVGYSGEIRIHNSTAFTTTLATIASQHTRDCAVISNDGTTVLFAACSESLDSVATYSFNTTTSALQLVGIADFGFEITGLAFNSQLYLAALVYGQSLIMRADIDSQGQITNAASFYSLPTNVPLGDSFGLAVYNAEELVFSAANRMYHLNIARLNLCGPLLGDQTGTNTTLENISIFGTQAWVSEGDSIAVYNITQEA